MFFLSVWLWPMELVVSPGFFFGRLREKWPWFPAYVLAVICNMGGTGLTLFAIRISFEDVLRQLPQQMLTISETIVVLAVGTILGAILSPLVISYAYSFVATILGLILQRSPDFSKLFSLAMWCFLPSFAIGSLVRGLLVTVKPELFPYATVSPAAFYPPTMAETLGYRLLSTLDVFQLTFYGLFTIGYSVIVKVPLKKSAIVSGILYLLQLVVVWSFTPR